MRRPAPPALYWRSTRMDQRVQVDVGQVRKAAATLHRLHRSAWRRSRVASGKGLQNPLHGFDSRRRLSSEKDVVRRRGSARLRGDR